MMEHGVLNTTKYGQLAFYYLSPVFIVMYLLIGAGAYENAIGLIIIDGFE